MAKKIIFDFDDTLIESKMPYTLTMQKTAEELGLRVPSGREIAAFGRGWDEFIKFSWPNIQLETFKEHYRKMAQKVPYKIIPGANEAIEQLSKDYVLYVLSKRPKEMLSLRVQQTGIRTEFFKAIFCNEDTRFKKPDPRAFDEILHDIKSLGDLKYENLLSVGDTIEDMAASVGAGIFFVPVLTGYGTKQDFLDRGISSERILDSVADLPKYLSNQN
jgi:phosphoglycolate phosphatase